MKANKVVSALKFWWPLLMLIGAIQLASAQDVITYYHADLTGSPVAGTDVNGNVVWREAYSPYGERLVEQISPASNRRWFTGHPHEEYTGLTYAGARHYDPVVGRFMGVDPAGVDSEQSFSFNRYAYGNNNPYSYMDPNGEDPESIYGLAIGLAYSESDARRIQAAEVNVGNGAAAAAIDAGIAIAGVKGAFDRGESIEAAATTAGIALIGVAAQKKISAGGGSRGRAAKQERLRELANDDKLGSADRGWIKQEMNAIDRGKRESIRVPPGKQLAHSRGREAAKGYDHVESPSQLQDKDLHKTQHTFDDFGRKNRERP